ncbi:MAG: hypothetical protein FWC15_03725 [Fibromonadales bacterium]|nr:hypothetical protein [Fibromonadales bacterium]
MSDIIQMHLSLEGLKRVIEEAKANVPESKIAEYKKGITKDEAKRRLFSQIKANGGRITVTSSDGKDGYINKKSARKILDVNEKSIKSDLTLEQYWAIAADIVGLYRNSTEVLEHSDYKNRSNVEGIIRFVSPLYEDNYAYITAKVIKNEGQKIHDLEISDIEKIGGKLEGTLVGATKKPNPTPAANPSPTNNIQNV